MIRYSKCRGCMFFRSYAQGEVITLACNCPRGCIRDGNYGGYTNPEMRMQDIERRDDGPNGDGECR